MEKLEKVYIGISILMVMASLSLSTPKHFFSYIWGEDSRYFPPEFLVGFFGFSLALGIILIVIGVYRKKDKKTLFVAKLFTFTFLISAVFNFPVLIAVVINWFVVVFNMI